MPEGLDIHHVLHAVAAAEVACKERGKHVTVAESLGIATAGAEEGIDSFTDTGAVSMLPEAMAYWMSSRKYFPGRFSGNILEIAVERLVG